MKGDIALAGFVLTAEEWDALDTRSRALLLAAAFHRGASWDLAPLDAVPAGEALTDDVRAG